MSDPLEERSNEAGIRTQVSGFDQFKTLIKPLASIRLTVVLLFLSIVLVFFGTIAQVNDGIWTVVEKYFRSWTVHIPIKLVYQFDRTFFGITAGLDMPSDKIAFPFPAGWTIGWIMFVNLVAAHLVRFRMTWKRAGVMLSHTGFLMLLLAEWVTGRQSVESVMTIVEGSSSNYVESARATELAISTPAVGGRTDRVVVFPGRVLAKGDRAPVTHPDLPFDVVVEEYFANSSVPRSLAPEDKNPANRGEGRTEIITRLGEVSGVDREQKIDAPGGYLTLVRKDNGEVLGTWMVSYFYQETPEKVTVDGTTYEMVLRLKRTYKPYSIFLNKFTHEVYPGTDTPKDFASEITMSDLNGQVLNKVRIYMNNPLFHEGETFYQQSFLKGDAGTVLQVVKNPGWWMPYVSCGLMTGGMGLHFAIMLMAFLNKSRRAV